ncbi:MAG: cupin domain-containing protein [Pseudomonadota bacterium]
METPEPFDTIALPDGPSGLAPDGSAVRLLCKLEGGSMAHFTLDPGEVAAPVSHRTVEELWYILTGEGEMWRRQGEREEVTTLRTGVSLTIPLGTHFQFRNTGAEPLTFVLVTMPPWPGPDEAFAVEGHWKND